MSLPADRIALVPAETFGPYVGSRPEGTIAAWAALVDGKRRWFTVGLDESGAPSGEPLKVADSAPEVDLVAVRPVGGKDTGFLLVTTSREFSGERVDALAFGLRGELRGGPTPLAEGLPDVVWVDVVPTASGAVAMWAVRRDDRADLFGIELGPTSDPKDRPVLVLPDVRAWQVVPVAGGMAIAAATAGKQRNERGPLRVVFLDAQAHVDKKLVVSEGATVEPDVDLVRIGERLVVGWSDRQGVEPRLMGAVVDMAGNLVKAPAPLGRAFGPQALVRLVPTFADAGPAYIAWENLIERPRGKRAIRLSTLSPDGVVGDASAVLAMAADGAVPELAATPNGLAALTLSPACERGGDCSASPIVPTFVALDASLDVVASEPLRLEALGGEPVDLAWGLGCNKLECMALAAAPATPSPVYRVKLQGISNRWEPSAFRDSDAALPRAEAVEAVGRADSVAELAAVRAGDGALLAWITYLDPSTPFARTKTAAPDGKYEAPRAIVRIQRLPDKGVRPEPLTLSYRGHSLGGVTLSPSEGGRGEALLAWAGVDNREPEVFLTLLAEDGKKVFQKMLTHTKGGVSDVALAPVRDGWVVAWIDERGGGSQVYVAEVDRTLKPIVAERRVGSTASVQTNVQLLTRGEHVLLVWSDARGTTPGIADLYGVRLAAKDLTPVGPEHLLATTPAHSRSPSAAAFGEGAVVAWVEDPPPGSEGVSSAVMLERLDSGGEPVAGTLTTLPFAGSPEGVTVACSERDCRVVATLSTEDGGGVDALEWRPDGEGAAQRLVRLATRPNDAVAPVVLGNDLFYADEARKGDVRLRRVGVRWR